MARRRKQTQVNWTVVIILSVFLSVVVMSGLSGRFSMLGIPTFDDLKTAVVEFLDGVEVDLGDSGSGSSKPTPVSGDGVSIHYIDVGQADSILIKGPTQNVLIDAGERDAGDTILKYLKSQGVEKIDLLIATHPHADHIGGMTDVVKGIEIGQVLMPTLIKSTVPTTKVYTNLLAAVKEKGLQITQAKQGLVYDLGGGAKLEIMGPAQQFEEMNNVSISSKLTYGENSMFFTGDMETEAEQAILDSGVDVSADILDLGHHGSSTSTSDAFFKAVNPQYAGISCGMDNSYGHPHKETLEKLKQAGVKVYRTDLNSTFVFTMDGKEISVSAAK